jgi:2-desacetyl-2-hydroxyethyl bacteriochlorophyllide A dehydrogenase
MHGLSVDGGLADQVRVDPRCLVPLPGGVRVTDAALVEPVAVALHALHQFEQFDAGAGQRLLVIGAGSIGQLVAAVSRRQGLDVSVVARHRAQVATAERLGASVRLAEEADRAGPSGPAGPIGPADEYDVVIDAAGTQASLDLAIQHVHPGGTVVVVATYWSPVEIGHALLGKEVRLVPAFTYGHHGGRREFEEAAAILVSDSDIPDAIVTHRLPLDEAAQAFQLAADRRAGAIKVLIEP